MEVKTIIELEEQLTERQKEKILEFFNKELLFNNTSIFDEKNYIQRSDFAQTVYDRFVTVIKDDYKEY